MNRIIVLLLLHSMATHALHITLCASGVTALRVAELPIVSVHAVIIQSADAIPPCRRAVAAGTCLSLSSLDDLHTHLYN